MIKYNLFLTLASMHLVGFVAFGQKSDYKNLLCTGTWVLDNYFLGDSEGIYTYRQYKKGDTKGDKTTYSFNKDGSFAWNSNRTCSKAIESGNGNGTWELNDKNTSLKFTFLNYKDESGKISTMTYTYDMEIRMPYYIGDIKIEKELILKEWIGCVLHELRE